MSTAYAVTHPGYEALLAAEMASLGIQPGFSSAGGVEFAATPETVARANLGLRTAGRVLLRVGGFHAGTFHELERHARKIAWDRFVPPNGLAHFRVTTKQSKLYHERAVVERLGDALQRRVPGAGLVAARSEAAADDSEAPIQRFVVRFHRDECLVSADTSGALLHRRGYRGAAGKAPLRETLAAGLLLAAGWDGSSPLIDPMCGSGTIPIEAALLARRIPPGWRRRFSFERWPESDPAVIAAVRADLGSRILERAPGPIRGSDRDSGAIAAASENAARAGVAGDIDWVRAPVSALALSGTPGWIVTNPPYGVRVGDRSALRNLYAQFGNVLRRLGGGWRVAMVSADPTLTGHTKLAWRHVADTNNGGVGVKLLVTDPLP